MIERFIQNSLTLKRWRRFKSHKLSMVSLIIFLLLIVFCLTSEIWANNKPLVLSYKGELYFPVFQYYHPSQFGLEGLQLDYKELEKERFFDWSLWPFIKWSPNESNLSVSSYPSPPSQENFFGTDDRGRDIFSRLIYGFRYSLGFSFAAWFFSYLMGIFLGAFMGFVGGKIDLLGQRLVEVLESLPVLMILITLVAIFGASFSLIVFISVLFGWLGISFYIRAEFLRLRKREFVEAARALGAGPFSIAFRQILPNAISPIVTFSPFALAGGISALTVLDYLGYGLPPPTPSWGELLRQAQSNVTTAWWLAFFPSAFLIFSVLILNLIGEGVRDSFDSRTVSTNSMKE